MRVMDSPRTGLLAGLSLAVLLTVSLPGLSQEEAPAAAPSTAPQASEPAAETHASFSEQIEREGISIGLTLESLDAGRAAFQEGDHVRVRFEIADKVGGQGLSRLYPAAWMDLIPEGDDPQGAKSCRQKVQNFIGGSLLHVPELDMNVYYVLTLNEDASLSVVDPLFGFGGSKLLTMVFLKSPGKDWAMTGDQARVFVSMPDSQEVAVVETASWKVVTNIAAAPQAGRVLLQPDEHFLWVAYEQPLPNAELSGVTVLDTRRLRKVEVVETGTGPHDLAVTDDSRYLFVTNQGDGTLSVIDIASLKKVKDLAVGGHPVSLAYSEAGRAVYVSDPDSGTLTAIDADRLEIVARLEAEPGLGSVSFAPGGRWAFVANPKANTVHIVDASTHRIVQTADVESEPDRVSFSDEMAYVRHRSSEIVLMIPLAQIGHEGEAVPVIDFPGGQNPPGKNPHPTPAEGIVQAPGASAVLVSNPLDETIYFYKEGMAAPMGNFKNYGRQPRAVQVVDRSLQETSPGVYETAVTLRRSGHYEVAFFLDSPRITHCFPVDVKENPALAHNRLQLPVLIQPLVEDREVTTGEEVTLRFKLTDPETQKPKDGLEDVNVLTFLSPGIWQRRQWATSQGDGVYEVKVTPPESGVYYVFLEIRSLNLRFNQSPSLILQATDPDAPSRQATTAGSSLP